MPGWKCPVFIRAMSGSASSRRKVCSAMPPCRTVSAQLVAQPRLIVTELRHCGEAILEGGQELGNAVVTDGCESRGTFI